MWYEAEIARAVQRVVVERLMTLAATADMPQVRAIATQKLQQRGQRLAATPLTERTPARQPTRPSSRRTSSASSIVHSHPPHARKSRPRLPARRSAIREWTGWAGSRRCVRGRSDEVVGARGSGLGARGSGLGARGSGLGARGSGHGLGSRGDFSRTPRPCPTANPEPRAPSPDTYFFFACTANIAPCGSTSAIESPPGISIGPFSTCPPDVFTVSTARLTSSTST